MRKRNAACFSFWRLCRSAAFAKELLQGFKNGGLKELCWIPSKAYPVQLNKWVTYIGTCLIYGAVTSV